MTTAWAWYSDTPQQHLMKPNAGFREKGSRKSRVIADFQFMNAGCCLKCILRRLNRRFQQEKT